MVSRTKELFREFMRNAILWNRDGCEGHLRIDYPDKPKYVKDVKDVMIDIGLKKVILGLEPEQVPDYVKYVVRVARLYEPKRVVFVVPDRHYFPSHIELATKTLEVIRKYADLGVIRKDELPRMSPIIVTHVVLDYKKEERAKLFTDLVRQYAGLFPHVFLGFAMRINPREENGGLTYTPCNKGPAKCVEKWLNYDAEFRKLLPDVNWDWFFLGLNKRVLRRLMYAGQWAGLKVVYGDTDNNGRVPNELVRKVLNNYARRLGRPIRGKGLYQTGWIDRCLIFHVWKYGELPDELRKYMNTEDLVKYW